MNPTVTGNGLVLDDERRHPRFEGRVACDLWAGEELWRCWIRDLAVGGAGLEPEMPALLGRMVRLECAALDLGKPLLGNVINVAENRTCITFDLPDDVESDLERFLEDNS